MSKARTDHDKRRYRRVYVRLSRHPVFRAADDAQKTAALYLLTGPQTNRLGCYMLSLALAAEDLDKPPAAVQARFKSVCEAFDWRWDTTNRVLYVPSWWEWNPP